MKNKMKKKITMLLLFAMVLTFAGCQKKAENESKDETTLTGKVTAVDGTTVTLQLGELEEGKGSADSGQGEKPPESSAGEQRDNRDMGTPPEKPEGEQGDNGDMGIPPEKPGGDQGGKGEAGTPPEPPSGGGGNAAPGGNTFTAGEETATADVTDAVITKETTEGTEDGTVSDIAVGDILVVVIGENQKATSVTIKNIGMPNGKPGGSEQGEIDQGSAANNIDKDGSYSNETYASTDDDENALRITGATVTLDGCKVGKDSGATTNAENGDFYGINAALLATDGANVTIKDATVKSSAQNGNGVFSYGEGTVVTISDSKITTTADNSGGIQTTGGATTNAENLQIETSGSSSAAIRSDRGGGTVNVDGGSYTSNGYNSPAVYSTADITVKNAALTANNSEALVIEGKNSIALENCTVSGYMSDTKGSSSDINVHNVMIYQSMSGDADVGTSVFSMKGGSLTSNNGDLIYVTNTHCILTLSDVKIDNRKTDEYFLLVSGNDASHGWGNAGSNGAQVEFTADGQTFDGDIGVDSISSLTMTLSNGSVYTGAVNIKENEQNGSAVDDNALITIDKGSTWNLTGDCTVTSLTNNGTINFNGYTITLADGTVLSK